MGNLPSPIEIVMGLLAVFVAVKVGMPLSSARNEAVVPLLGKCVPLFIGELSGTELPANIVLCGMGTILFLLIPGTIGVGLLVFRRGR